MKDEAGGESPLAAGLATPPVDHVGLVAEKSEAPPSEAEGDDAELGGEIAGGAHFDDSEEVPPPP